MQAIYVRQSVDKKDSISIETQIERCMVKLDTKEDFEVYNDKGISGKSTENRPGFQRMLSDLRTGNLSKIIVYKFDRISRSLYDFLKMQKEFSKYRVDLISCEESIDTSTTSGKLMLNILMSFSESEREVIQNRITDNYYARGAKGLYLGGYAAFGYNKIDIQIDGKKTYAFDENIDESPILKKIYTDYNNGNSLAEISRWLNDKKIPTRKNSPWNSTCLSRILRNPVYVKANADVYNYLVSLGATMNNSINEYTGMKGCYAYGNPDKRTGIKFSNLKNDFITLGMHKGIIDASLWLNVQSLLTIKKNHSNLGTGSLTWLQGLVKCSCGYTYYVKRCIGAKKEYRYLYCRGRKNNSCPYPRTMMPVEKIENIAEQELLLRLQNLKGESKLKVVKDTHEINAIKIEIAGINTKINNLIEQISEGTDLAIQYLNKHIDSLDSKKQSLLDEITKLELKENKKAQIRIDINDVTTNWQNYDLETKKEIAKEVIEKIVLEGKTVRVIFY